MSKFKTDLDPRYDDLAIWSVPGFDEGDDNNTLMRIANYWLATAVNGERDKPFRFTHEGHSFRGTLIEDEDEEEGVSITLEYIGDTSDEDGGGPD